MSLIYVSQKNLDSTADIVNQAGVVRGTIQHTTKLTVLEPDVSLHNQFKLVDETIDRLLSDPRVTQDSKLYRQFTIELQQLQMHWLELAELLSNYTQNSDLLARNNILKQSNLCWVLSNNVVLAAEIAATDKSLNANIILNTVLVLMILSSLSSIIMIYFLVSRRLERETFLDGLTGIANRRSFDRTLDYERKRANRNQSPFSLILFDIDHFKKTNDTWGHLKGDDVLKSLSGLVSESIRKSDSLYRVGGEEFAILCPETSAAGAQFLADSVRRRIEHFRFPIPDPVTISLGVAEYSGEKDNKQLYDKADQALYQAKENGRNQVVLFE